MSNPSKKEIENRFTQAFELHSSSDFAAAEKIYICLLKFSPESGLLHYNLGLLYFQTEAYERALTHYSTARQLAPKDPDALFNLALCQKKLGLLHDAVTSFNEFNAAYPDDQEGLYSLGNCYRELKKYAHAVKAYQQVLTKEPDHLSANKNLAYVFHLLGDSKNALSYYYRVEQLAPDNAQAQHMIAAITGEHSGSTPEEYIKDIFNNYSETFDADLLGGLSYTVPEKLRSAIDILNYPVRLFSRCIDLGCGTGLAGIRFKDLCEHLTGIDLSDRMIKIAKEKNIYDITKVSEIAEYLKTKREEYDLVVAADVLSYIGDLSPLFAVLTPATTQQVLFCFSTENCAGHGFKLCSTGRFAHSQQYILATAKQYGWVPMHMITTDLRKEQEEWVEGTLYFLIKQGSFLSDKTDPQSNHHGNQAHGT